MKVGRSTKALANATLVALMLVAPRALDQPLDGLPELLNSFVEADVFYEQLEIAKQIVEIGDDDALSGLEAWLDHEDRRVRGNVAFVFAGLDDNRGFATLYAILVDYSDRPLGQGIPGRTGSASDRWWLRSQILADRYYAVHLLGVLRDPRALGSLSPLLSDREINYKVAWALGEIGDPSAIPALREAATDFPAVATEAERAIAAIESKRR